MSAAHIAALWRYPLKSARGHNLQRVTLQAAGFEHDREWMIVDARGTFVTQREQPRLALLDVSVSAAGVTLHTASLPALQVAAADGARPLRVRVWRSYVDAQDAGDEAARWLSDWLAAPHRLVHFSAPSRRYSNRTFTRGIAAPLRFADGYPIMVLGAASLDDLAARVGAPLPVDRFRPNIVLAGLAPYAEDSIHELRMSDVHLRLVKPCTRCVITCTDQQHGVCTGEEPLRTLRQYRYDSALRGVVFGMNAIIVSGVGCELQVGAPITVEFQASAR